MTMNGDFVDRLVEAERDRLLDRMVECRVKMALIERRRAEEREAEAALRRSQMSPLEKSRYIRSKGLQAYQALPWS
jgi:hypothetical protein